MALKFIVYIIFTKISVEFVTKLELDENLSFIGFLEFMKRRENPKKGEEILNMNKEGSLGGLDWMIRRDNLGAAILLRG